MVNALPLPLPTALLGWLPVSLVNAVLAETLALMQCRHPGVFERLAGVGDKIVRVEPDDLPIAFALALGAPPDRPWLRVARPSDSGAAVVRGSFTTLLDLLQGRCDGDGLFFARTLTVEGDMEVVVALRNAVDGEGIDLVEDLFSVVGPFGPLLAHVARLIASAAAALPAGPRHALELARQRRVGPDTRPSL